MIFHRPRHRFFKVFLSDGASTRKSAFSRNAYKTNDFSYFFGMRATDFEMRAADFSIKKNMIFHRFSDRVFHCFFDAFLAHFGSIFSSFSLSCFDVFFNEFSTSFLDQFWVHFGSILGPFWLPKAIKHRSKNASKKRLEKSRPRRPQRPIQGP